MRTFSESVVNRHAYECALALASSWEVWRGDCCVCRKVDAVGFCDRCTECAIDSVYDNEDDHGGTSEYVRDHLGVAYGSGRCVLLLRAVVAKTIEYQANIWRVMR